MPANITFEGKILTTEEFASKLNELDGEKAYDKIADLMYQACTDYYNGRLEGDSDPAIDGNLGEITRFLATKTATYAESKEIPPENYAFIQGLSEAISKKFINTTLEQGQNFEKNKKKIKSGQVPEAQLIKDEPKKVDKLAHDLTLRESGVTFDAVCHFQLCLTGALVNKTINGKTATDVFSEEEIKVKESVSAEQNVSIDTLDDYAGLIRERDYNSSLGFRYKKPGLKLAEGESPFIEIPDTYKNIMNCKTSAELNDYEAKQIEIIDAYKDYENQIKAYVKVGKALYKEFKSIGWDKFNGNKDENYDDLFITLENFTKLGTNYKYYSPNMNDTTIMYLDPKLIKESDFINHADVENAALNIDRSLEKVFDKASNRLEDLKAEGKMEGNPEYDAAQRMLTVLQNFHDLKKAASVADNEYYADHGIRSINDIEKVKTNIKYIQKARKLRNYIPAPEVGNDPYIVDVENTMKKLWDSYASCVVHPLKTDKAAEKLAEALRENKRIYKKMQSADVIEDDNVRKEYFKLYEKNVKKVDSCIKKCINYAENYNMKPIVGKKIDNIGILKDISKIVNGSLKAQKIIVEEQGLDKYIRLHTGTNSGKKVGEKKQDVAKIIAATALKEHDAEFSVKTIHRVAKVMDEIFCISNNPSYKIENGGKEKLLNATKDSSSAKMEYDRLRVEMYGIKRDGYDDFLKEMKILSKSMRPDKGRSDEYQNLVASIKTVAGLGEKTKNMDPKEKELLFAKANINVVLAVRMYVRGKEKIRFQDKGNDAFDNSMDALAIISKYTKHDNLKMNAGIYNITSKIIEKSDREYLKGVNIEKIYGSERAAEAHKKRMEKSNSKQKKPTETKKGLV